MGAAACVPVQLAALAPDRPAERVCPVAVHPVEWGRVRVAASAQNQPPACSEVVLEVSFVEVLERAVPVVVGLVPEPLGIAARPYFARTEMVPYPRPTARLRKWCIDSVASFLRFGLVPLRNRYPFPARQIWYDPWGYRCCRTNLRGCGNWINCRSLSRGPHLSWYRPWNWIWLNPSRLAWNGYLRSGCLAFSKIVQQDFHARRSFRENNLLLTDIAQPESLDVIAQF